MSTTLREVLHAIESLEGGPPGPNSDPPTAKNGNFQTVCPISQKQFSNLFLFHTYSFYWMSTTHHEELDPIESLEWGLSGPNWSPRKQNMTISRPFVQFLKNFSVTFVLVMNITSMGWGLPVKNILVPIESTEAPKRAPKIAKNSYLIN